MDTLDLKTTRPALPAFDEKVRTARDLPTMTRHRWLKGPVPRPFRWLLENPDAARALAEEAERLSRAPRQAA
jgi:hypothetical protein